MIFDAYNLKQRLGILVLLFYHIFLIIYYIHIGHHDVIISESTTKRKRYDEEERYSCATQSDIYIVESEDESQHPKRSRQG